MDATLAIEFLRREVRERQEEADRWVGGSSYDFAMARRDEAAAALDQLGVDPS